MLNFPNYLTFNIVYGIQRSRFVSCLIYQWLIDWLMMMMMIIIAQHYVCGSVQCLWGNYAGGRASGSRGQKDRFPLRIRTATDAVDNRREDAPASERAQRLDVKFYLTPSSLERAGWFRLAPLPRSIPIHRVELRHRIYGHDTIVILWV